MIKVLIVDDHALLREGLRSVLELEEDIAVEAEAECGTRAIELVEVLRPDIVVMDMGLPDMSGVEVTKRLLATQPCLKVLALTMFEKEYIKDFFDAGGLGYVNKSYASEDIVCAIRTVAAGQVYLSTENMRALLPNKDTHSQKAKDPCCLSPREREVLVYLAKGYKCREIGEKIFISTRTVETYRNRIMEKLELNHLSEIVDYAVKHNLLK